MSAHTQSLEEIVKALPLDAQKEVQVFIDSVMQKRQKKAQRKLRFDWAGAIKDLRDKDTSVELQHKISE